MQSGPEPVSLAAESTSAAARAGDDGEHLLKKPKLELSPPQSLHDEDGDHRDRGDGGGGGVDNNNVSPGSAFRPWNADEEGAAHPGREGVHNGEVAERKLDPYLMRGNRKAS